MVAAKQPFAVCGNLTHMFAIHRGGSAHFDSQESMGTVVNIFTAAARGAPMEPRTSVVALADVGLQGDRYADASVRRGPEYQVTLIEIENIEAFAKTATVLFTNDMPRRNLVTRGVSLNDLYGKRFKVGNATFDGLELCEPCALFASRTHRDVLKHFLRRGGLRARIVIGGEINVGDTVGVDS
jgi:MOSC domain-containing protein YiiM